MATKAQLKSLAFVIFSLILTACSTKLSAPEQIEFQGHTYQKVNHSKIDDMQQLLYLPSSSSKNPNDWQRGLLLFLDQNRQQMSLEARAALRKKAFERQGAKAQLHIAEGELKSQVRYPPTPRFPDILLEVTRGRNLACGYGQMQFADKLQAGAQAKTKTEENAHLSQITAQFETLAWQIYCQ